jgi:hypothetical protein
MLPSLGASMLFVLMHPQESLRAAGSGIASPSHILFPINLFFLSAGLRIWNEHIKVSSTLIIAPALSNSPQ